MCEHELEPCNYWYDDDWGVMGNVLFTKEGKKQMCYCKKCNGLFVRDRKDGEG